MKDYKVIFHFEGLEKHKPLNTESFKGMLEDIYVSGRSKCCDIFNAKIDSINDAWNETGLPTTLGEYDEINPEYTKFINDALADDFKDFNAKESKLCSPLEFYLDEMSDIRARLKLLPDVSIYITLMEEES